MPTCNVTRRVRNINQRPQPGIEPFEDWFLSACGRLLVTEQEVRSGICSACGAGFETPPNRFPSVHARNFAMWMYNYPAPPNP